MVLPFLVLVLLSPRLFSISFFLFVVLLSNISNFFPITPNIPNQTSYCPIYTMFLPYTFLVILLYKTLYDLLSLFILTLLYILLQTFPPGLLHSPNSPLVPKYLFLLYTPSIIPNTCFFL